MLFLSAAGSFQIGIPADCFGPNRKFIRHRELPNWKTGRLFWPKSQFHPPLEVSVLENRQTVLAKIAISSAAGNFQIEKSADCIGQKSNSICRRKLPYWKIGRLYRPKEQFHLPREASILENRQTVSVKSTVPSADGNFLC